MKGSNQYTLKEAIQDLIKAYDLSGRLSESRILQSWEDVTGRVIARHTQSLYIRNKILYVKLDSPALKNELLFARQKIVDMLNNAVGEKVVEDIIFR
jgi:predicted nucleic acid-binding Zn ribbon protein